MPKKKNAISQHAGSVLLIDPDEVMHEQIGDLIAYRFRDYDLVWAKDVQEALQLLGTLKFKALITEEYLSLGQETDAKKDNGDKFIAFIRENSKKHNKHLPILLMTNDLTPSLARQLGVTAYIKKGEDMMMKITDFLNTHVVNVGQAR